MSKVRELEAEIAKLQKELMVEKEKEREEKIRKNVEKINAITPEQKEFLLSHIKHMGANCSDEHPCNGILGGEVHCPKCALIEILNGLYDDFDFSLEVRIHQIK